MSQQRRGERRNRRGVIRGQQAAKQAQRRRQLTILAAAVSVALVAVLVLVLVNQPWNDEGIVVADATPDIGQPVEGRVLGDPNAPVRIVEWGDYQ